MQRYALDKSIAHKFFYRNYYRRALWMLMVSLMLTGGLLLAIYYQMVSKKEPNYYASNAAGAGFIIRIKPMAAANARGSYLLAPDKPAEATKKPVNL